MTCFTFFVNFIHPNNFHGAAVEWHEFDVKLDDEMGKWTPRLWIFTLLMYYHLSGVLFIWTSELVMQQGLGSNIIGCGNIPEPHVYSPSHSSSERGKNLWKEADVKYQVWLRLYNT